MKPGGFFRTGKLPAIGLAFALAGVAHGRVWTDSLKRTWDGDFLRVDGANAVFMVRGQEYPFPLANLSAADKAFISAQTAAATKPPAGSPPAANLAGAAATGSASAAGGPLDFLGVTLQPGKTVEGTAKAPPVAAKSLAFYYKKPSDTVKVAIAVPQDFDPSKPQRLLITSASSSGDGLSIKNMGTYTATALARGWVVMSADGENGKPQYDNPGFREALLLTLLSAAEAKWPKAKTTWSVATAGFSGGAGYASNQSLILVNEGWQDIGTLLMNSTYNPQSWEHTKGLKFSAGKMHKIPVFVSGGETDNTQKLGQIKPAFDALKKAGYKKTRMETHPGGHSPSKEHIAQALEWFESLEKETKAP